MKKKLLTGLITGLTIFLFTISVSEATTIASSNFNGSSQGWTWFPSDPGISWQSTGGNPDGYMRYDNNIPYGAAATASIYAPSTFLGNWETLGVTGLSYEANIFTTGRYAAVGNYSTIISGPGGKYQWVGPSPNPAVSWLNLEAALLESEWTKVSGDWNALLGNVTELRIVMAYYTNYTPFEITGIDNVTLNGSSSVPEPITMLLLGTGIAGLAGVRLRRKKQ